MVTHYAEKSSILRGEKKVDTSLDFGYLNYYGQIDFVFGGKKKVSTFFSPTQMPDFLHYYERFLKVSKFLNITIPTTNYFLLPNR